MEDLDAIDDEGTVKVKGDESMDEEEHRRQTATQQRAQGELPRG